MVAVNKQSILGSIVPNVYIKKITLETAGEDVVERNPHIDHEREPDVIRNPDTGKVERTVRTPDLLRKSQVGSEPLTVTIDLLVKERLDKGVVASWFGEIDFMKYLKIQIVQSMNEESTRLYSTKKLNISPSTPKVDNFEGVSFRFLSVAELVTNSLLDQHQSYTNDDGSQVHDISFRLSYSILDSNPRHLTYFAVSYIDLEDLPRS